MARYGIESPARHRMTAPRARSASDLRERVLDAARLEQVPSRPIQMRRHAALIALGFAASGAIAVIKQTIGATGEGPFAPGAGRRLWLVVAEGGIPTQDPPLGFVVTLEFMWFLVACVATWAGIARGRSMLGRSSASKLGVATVTPVALVITWLAVAFIWRRAVLPIAWLEAMTDGALVVHFHVSCALMSVVYAAGPLLAFLAIRRRRYPVTPRLTGAAFGAVAGVWGAVVHFPFCACTSPLHMALGHVLPVVGLAALGALAGDRVLGVRASPS
jgi:hypothetical protein